MFTVLPSRFYKTHPWCNDFIDISEGFIIFDFSKTYTFEQIVCYTRGKLVRRSQTTHSVPSRIVQWKLPYKIASCINTISCCSQSSHPDGFCNLFATPIWPLISSPLLPHHRKVRFPCQVQTTILSSNSNYSKVYRLSPLYSILSIKPGIILSNTYSSFFSLEMENSLPLYGFQFVPSL